MVSTWVLGTLFTYVFSSLTLFLIASKLLRSRPEHTPLLLGLTLGLGPLAISWMLTTLLLLLPARTPFFYVFFIVAVFFAAFAACRSELGKLRTLATTLRADLRRLHLASHWPHAIFLLTALALWFSSMMRAVLLPLTDNDPLEYGVLAKYLFTHRNALLYPVLTPDPTTGYFDAVAHPLGFASLEAWHLFFQGDPEFTLFVKLVSPMFLLYLAVLIGVTLGRRNAMAGALGALFTVGSPALLSLASVSHIDPVRVYAFFVPFCALYSLREWPGWRPMVFVGVTAAMALFTHSIGLLVLPMLALAIWRVGPGTTRERLARFAIVVATAGVLSGQRYVDNLRRFGAPIYNGAAVFETFDARLKDYMRYERGLVSPGDRMRQGLLRGFEQREYFGLLFWLYLCGAVWLLWSRARDPFISLCAQLVGAYFGFLALSVAVGFDLPIMNPRYLVTIVPFAACVVAAVIAALYEEVFVRAD